MIKEPQNVNSRYNHANRIMIRFFPEHKTEPDDAGRLENQFYTNRTLYYLEEKSGQGKLF